MNFFVAKITHLTIYTRDQVGCERRLNTSTVAYGWPPPWKWKTCLLTHRWHCDLLVTRFDFSVGTSNRSNETLLFKPFSRVFVPSDVGAKVDQLSKQGSSRNNQYNFIVSNSNEIWIILNGICKVSRILLQQSKRFFHQFFFHPLSDLIPVER